MDNEYEEKDIFTQSENPTPNTENYNDDSFMKQFSTVWVRLAKCSLPNEWNQQITGKTHAVKSVFSYFKAKLVS